MGRGVGDGKSGQNQKPDAFLKPQQKIQISTFFSIFLVRIFSDPKFWQSRKCPPTSRLGTSGPRGRRRKNWSKLKTGRNFEIATKKKISTFFSIFLVPIFSDPKLDPGILAESKVPPPTSRVGTSGPGRVGDEKSGQNQKPDAFLKSQ